jgi:hypothetical protein
MELEHERSLAMFVPMGGSSDPDVLWQISGQACAISETSPFEARPRCAAAWIHGTMDPEGAQFHCGERDRSDRSNNVSQMGVARAFVNLTKTGGQCYCARSVEENYT